MPKPTKKQQNLKMSIGNILSASCKYIRYNAEFCVCLFVVNMVFMLVIKNIPSGISNPLSLVWFVCYYMFWCFFFRYYYHLRPYFDFSKLAGSLAPSSKAIILLALVSVLIVFLPMLPLFLGYKDLYLDFYEQYLVLTVSNGPRAFCYKLILYGAFTLLMPALICRPYLAWIASLRGRNASFSKVGDKTRGNFWQFFVISLMLIYPEVIADHLDNAYNLQGWLSHTVGTITFMLTNIIFAKIYDFFYIEH